MLTCPYDSSCFCGYKPFFTAYGWKLLHGIYIYVNWARKGQKVLPNEPSNNLKAKITEVDSSLVNGGVDIQNEQNKTHLFGLLGKGLEHKLNPMPLMGILLFNQLKPIDVSMVLKVPSVLLMALIWIILTWTRKNESFYVIRFMGVMVTVHYCLYIIGSFLWISEGYFLHTSQSTC